MSEIEEKDKIPKEYIIPSVVIKESPQEDIESFSVLYDFFKRTKGSYLQKQKGYFKKGLTLMILSVFIFMLLLYLNIPTTYFILPVILILISLFLIVRFFKKKPEYIGKMQKVYWPFAVDKIHPNKERFAAFDMTEKGYNNTLEHLVIQQDKVDRLVNSLPDDCKSYDREKQVRTLLTELENFTSPKTISTPVLGELLFEDLIGYTKQADNNDKNSLSGISFDEIQKISNRISDEIITSQDTVDYSHSTIQQLQNTTDVYIKHFDKITKNEKKYALSCLGGYLQRTKEVPSFFDKSINKFYDDIRSELKILGSIRKKEISSIKNRMHSEKRNFSTAIDQLVLQLEELRKRHSKEFQKNQYKNQTYQATKESFKDLKRTALNRVDLAMNEVEEVLSKEGDQDYYGKPEHFKTTRENQSRRPDSKEGPYSHFWNDPDDKVIDDKEMMKEMMSTELSYIEEQLQALDDGFSEGKPDFNMELEQQNYLNKDYTSDHITNYKTEIHGVHNKVNSLTQRLKELEESIGEPLDDLERRVNELENRIESTIKEGESDLKDALKNLEQNHKVTKRYLEHLENLKEICAKTLEDTQSLLGEEMYRHLEPLEEKKDFIRTERERINQEFETSIDSCHDFLDEVHDISFSYPNYDPIGIYWIPFWIIQYNQGGSKKTMLYSISTLGYNGYLSPVKQGLDMDVEWFMNVFDDQIPQGIDDNLLEDIDIKESREKFNEQVEISYLDSLTCLRGMINLVK